MNKISDRQKELSKWFGDFFGENNMDIDADFVYDDDLIIMGLSPSAKFCFGFMNKLSESDTIRYMQYQKAFTVFIPFSKSTGTAKKGFLEHFRVGSPLEKLQESVRQAIIWLPAESKQVIEGMNND